MSSYDSEDELSQDSIDLQAYIDSVLKTGVTADELVALADHAMTVENSPALCFEWLENFAVTQMTTAEIIKLVQNSEENSDRARALHFLFGDVRRCIFESIIVTGLLPVHRELFPVDTLISKLIERIQGFIPSKHVLEALACVHYRRD